MARIVFKTMVLGVSLFIALPLPAGFTADDPADSSARRQLTNEIEKARREPEPIETRPAPKTEVVVEEEKPAPPSGPAGPSFTVKKIQIEGNTVFSTQSLEQFTKPYENRKINFEDLRNLTNEITQHYRSQGYVTSRTYIPPQEMKDGAVTLRVMEGRVGKIIVENNKWFRKGAYEKYFPAPQKQVFRLQDFETALAGLNTQPDRAAKAYLIAGETPGSSDVILKTEERFPVHAGYEFHNRGTKFTHRQRHDIFISHNNLTGFGDTLNTSISMAEEGAFLGGSAQYRYYFPGSRTTFNFDTSISKSQLVKHLKPFDVDGDSFSLIPGITQNFLRNRRWSLDGNLAFEIKDSKTTVGDDKVAYDRVRVLRFGPQAEIRDATGKTRIGGDAHLGIPGILGGSEAHDRLASRRSSGGQFLYYTASLSRLQKLPYHSFGIFRLGGQVSPTTLNSMEQYRLGGVYSVRGYPEGDSAGDYGFGFSSEIRVPPPFIPDKWKLPFAKRPLKDSFNLIGFFEGGKTYLLQRETPETEKNRLLLGAGYGFRFYFDQYVSVSFDIGYPFGDDSTDSNLPQAHFSVKVEY